jgi:hypothetical protein
MMGYEESYNKRMGLMVLFGEYFKAVKEDLGMEKALEYANTQIIDRAFDPPESPYSPLEVRDRLRGLNPMAGISSKVELIGDEVVSTNGKCVFYDGWIAAGLSPVEVEQLCRVRFDAYGENPWKKMNPNIEVELRKYKQNPEDTCIEVLKFK